MSKTRGTKATPEIRRRAIEYLCNFLLKESDASMRGSLFLEMARRRGRLPEGTTAKVLKLSALMLVWLARGLADGSVVLDGATGDPK